MATSFLCEATTTTQAARTCQHCGGGFVPYRLSGKQRRDGHVQRFCSRACLGLSLKRYENKQEQKRAWYARYRDRKRKLSVAPLEAIAPLSERKCQKCGIKYSFRSLDHVECWSCRVKIPRQTKPCVDCGVMVVGTAAKRRCYKCSRKVSRRFRRHRDRAKHFGVAYEPINPIKVFERDAWRCQMCGVKTPKKLRGSFKPNAPELDHRIPMALGGPHTWGNVQCSCRRCNMEKGASRALGQMQLFDIAL